MKTWILVALSCLACVTAGDELGAMNDTLMMSPGERGFEPLVLVELRKVLGVLSPRGRDHTVLKVLLQDHKPLVNVTTWELQLEGEIYTFMDDDPRQTQLEFGADLADADSIIIFAKNNKDVTLNGVIANLDIQDMQSRVARVGGGYDPLLSSLRVATGGLQAVQVGEQVCKKDNSPCYYLRTKLPENISRCLDIEYSNSERGYVSICDDTITSFTEISERVELQLEGNNLTVEAKFITAPSKVEVVVFDPSHPTTVLSPDGYECRPKGEPRQLSHVCHQQLTRENDLQRLLVLVVGLDQDGFVLESRIDGFVAYVPQESNKGVIVGCVIGVLVAIALIAGIFVYVKGNKEKSAAAQSRASSKYERTATTEPPAQEEA